MDQLLTVSQYFPNIHLFAHIIKSGGLIIEAHEHYQKQTYRNRCNILTSSGVQMLIVPVLKPITRLIRDVKIDYSQRWQKNHLRAIQTAYGKAPYFEYYIGLFSKTIMSNHAFLFDINVEIQTLCLKILKLHTEINFTTSFTIMHPDGINDMRYCKPNNSDILTEYNTKQNPYYQLFGNKFVDNLSIIDLIFNEGTNATHILSNV